jgi:two-component system sensor histidine kinase KdpD
MLVLAILVALGWVTGALSDRRRPAVAPAAPSDPTVLLNAVSHELRNPLSTIRAASTDLRDGRHVDDAARRDELLDLVVTETDRLDRLVGNLLHAGRARAGRLVADCGPESLRAVVDCAIVRLAQVHPQRIVNDVPVDLPAVMIDPVLIEQVIANLVDNSARVSPAGSPICVDAVRAADTVLVTVTDTGPGFPRSSADPFEAYVSAAGSSGLGLAICRAIVDAHGGTIDLVSVPAGAAVRFTLPVADLD